MRREKTYTRQELINLLKAYAQEHGVPPTKRQLNADPAMPSIRKTKKRLKREIAELQADFDYYDKKRPMTIDRICLLRALHYRTQQLKQELQQLKRKKV